MSRPHHGVSATESRYHGLEMTLSLGLPRLARLDFKSKKTSPTSNAEQITAAKQPKSNNTVASKPTSDSCSIWP